MPYDQAEATRLLNATWGKVAYTAPTTPIMGRLMTANGTATSNGTEVANAGGSSYAAQSLTAGLGSNAAAASISNTAAITWTNMPAVTTVGLEAWDSAGTPRRQQYGSLTASKVTQLGDSLSLAAAALVSTQS